jgi:sRNA-binding carbon storage regulator CsrA
MCDALTWMPSRRDSKNGSTRLSIQAPSTTSIARAELIRHHLKENSNTIKGASTLTMLLSDDQALKEGLP